MTTINHPNYTLVDGDRIVRNADAPPLTAKEDEEILSEVARFVEAKIMAEYGFVPIQIPEDEDPSTSILASPDWINATKLLLIVQNSYGSQLGIFSRSTVFDEGLSKGTWLPYIQRAHDAGYAVLLLRPNTNSVTASIAGEAPQKVLIKGSESPEIHALNVWENVVSRAESVRHIALLGYGNGASLCKDLFLREMVNNGDAELNRVKAFVSIEASNIVGKDDSDDIRELLVNISINMECNAAAKGYRLGYRKEQLGCTSLSLGLPEGVKEVKNVAAGVSLGMESVFKYLTISESGGAEGTKNLAKNFATIMARDNGLDPNAAVVAVNPFAGADDPVLNDSTSPYSSNQSPDDLPNAPVSPYPRTNSADTSAAAPKPGFFGRIIRRTSTRGSMLFWRKVDDADEKLTVKDFDLLKIVGKGAFGKVMLVRKKRGNNEGKVFAMKVLRKEVVVAKGQVDNTKAERDILFEIKHPFIVRLRYAFQNENKLYLVTDYYNGGTLYYHLKREGKFEEMKAKFYAAELLAALHHLHESNILYRDLKLENVLLDREGHIALTDFGLSKQNIDSTGGAKTFCGTAEYIAPEQLRGHVYGPAVDWWSFGIMLYEMMNGQTPFYDKNRKEMFRSILSRTPQYPSFFSSEAKDCIGNLLQTKVETRLGARGGEEIMRAPFFASINFAVLLRREIRPPFIPDVIDELDTRYVPKAYLLTQAKDSIVAKNKKSDHPEFQDFSFRGGNLSEVQYS